MQSVIELGRVTRERNTLPLKYPLKEVVAIHRDPEALNDIKSLQSYIMEELNVREVKVTQDKSSYGAHLVAEADFKTLGAKLKVKVILPVKGEGNCKLGCIGLWLFVMIS